jgi:hypothetical protein
MQAVAKLKGWMQVVATVALVTLLAACGGGGSSSSSSGTDTSGLPASPTAQPVASSSGNTAPITVGQGVANVINIPTVSVTICVPGTTTCQTINNVQVDTGSYGLRIVSSALTIPLPFASAGTGSSNILAECTTFADGYSWGSVRTASVQIANEKTAGAIPVQILGDLAAGVPTGCASGSEENTASAIGANGILGIGVAPVDCGSNCATPALAAIYSNYYSCTGSSCLASPVTVSLTNQVANPVANFVTDNNGVIVEMAPVSATGQASATGTLVFGINTATNNKLAAANVFTTDSSGDLNNSTFNGSKTTAFFDSGSNAYFFADGSLTLCSGSYSGFYCPGSGGQTRTVNLIGQAASPTATASIGILSASTLFANGSSYAFNDLGGQVAMAGTFDIGLPFFYGRYMYYGIDQTANGGQQPYVGY